MPTFNMARVFNDEGSVNRWLERIKQDFSDAGYANPPPRLFLQAIDKFLGGTLEEFVDECPEINAIFAKTATKTSHISPADVNEVIRRLKTDSSQFSAAPISSQKRCPRAQMSYSVNSASPISPQKRSLHDPKSYSQSSVFPTPNLTESHGVAGVLTTEAQSTEKTTTIAE